MKSLWPFAVAASLCALLFGAGCRTPLPAESSTPAQPPAAEPESSQVRQPEDEDAYHQVRVLTKAMMIVRRHYVDEEKTGYKDLIHHALGGMLQSLDPHSQFMEPDTFQDLKDDTQGAFGGLGIVIGVRDSSLTVVAPMEDTPAYRAGLLAGDRIVEIDGQKTDGLTVPEAVRKLRGEVGTQVRLKVQRGAQFTDYTLTRDVIKVASVKGAAMLDTEIGYIRITQFNDPTADALQAALEKLLGQGMRALVLDLRNNPGGLLTSAVEVAAKFLRSGDLIVTTRGREDVPAAPPALARGPHHYTDFPLAILVNSGTASAAEIVAAALQDHSRAVLIGTTTFGKGSVQSLIPIDDNLALRLTTARYYTPSERVIHDHGIEPDIAVPVTADEWQAVQAQRARRENPELFPDQDKTPLPPPVIDTPLQRATDLLRGVLIVQSRG
jgi:carboxyl-terminal processing protease